MRKKLKIECTLNDYTYTLYINIDKNCQRNFKSKINKRGENNCIHVIFDGDKK